jgi:hypothetical protein
MKKTYLAVVLVLLSAALFAEQFENPMLNMTVPSGLEDSQAYIVINHKFMRTLYNYPKDDLYAVFDGGANFNLDFRYMIGWNIEAQAGYTTTNREQTAGLSYTFNTPKLFFNSSVDVQFFTYRDPATGTFNQNLFYLLSLQTIPFFEERAVLTADAGYDGFNSHIGLGLGASYEIFKHIRVLAEYFPVFNETGSTAAGTTGCYSFGVKIDTFGHQFMFTAGNSSQIGTRRMMLGTNVQDVFVGLKIMRLIAF